MRPAQCGMLALACIAKWRLQVLYYPQTHSNYYTNYTYLYNVTILLIYLYDVY